MIIKKVALHNFGIFKGHQEVTLEPPSKDKPIILFGGLNGAGKTTFLDAIQLALFGKLAKCSNRRNQAYDRYLRECINRDINPSEGASITLSFSFNSEGQTLLYRICRHWHETKGVIQEHLTIYINDEEDPVLSDTWAEHVIHFVQPEILELFFFDSEKIAKIAEPDQAPRFLKTAIQSMLGLENVDRLEQDLKTIIKRKTATELAPKERQKQKDQEKLLTETEAVIARLQERQSRTSDELERYRSIKRRLEKKFQSEGGELYLRLESLKQEKDETIYTIKQLKKELISIASGQAPLALLENQLKDLKAAITKEQQATANNLLKGLLEERDKATLNFLKEHQVPKIVVALTNFLEQDRFNRKPKEDQEETTYGFGDHEAAQLDQLIADIQPGRTYISSKISLLQSLQDKLMSIERHLANTPDFSIIATTAEQLENTNIKIIKNETILKTQTEEIEKNNKKKESIQQSIYSFLDKEAAIAISNKEHQRVIAESRAMIELMSQFKKETIDTNLAKLEASILESYHHILRKTNLIAGLRIDPQTYSLELQTEKGHTLQKERLSAGELQLLAVAMVWGLMKASQRPLPSLIDTPLGRLDSEHRRLLLENYYPNASHQVILLSTDEEIDASYFSLIAPHVGRTYHLMYDESSASTRINPGYFPEVCHAF